MNFGGIDRKLNDESWESLLSTANNDFVSVLVLWYTGITPASTYAWMLPHTLEKYLKSFLLKNKYLTNSELRNFGKSGHGLKEIWGKFRSVCSTTTSKPKLNDSFDKIIDDLDSIVPKLRYSGSLDLSSDRLLYFYVTLSSFIRYLLIGKQKYRSSMYGLDGENFLPMNFDPMSLGYGEIIVRKMLHISLEHAGALTNLGFVNQMPFDDFSISNTAIFEKMEDCPICNGGDVSALSMVKFYRKLSPTPYVSH